jgi:hypothetical protein
VFTPARLRDSIDWVVGPDEIASMNHFISRALPNAHSVVLAAKGFYSHGYDTVIAPSRWANLQRVVLGPIILARLMNRARGFLYVGYGFLLKSDQREFEFSFLKKHGRALVIYWTGTDIRSTVLMNENEKATGLPNVSTYLGEMNQSFNSAKFEQTQRRVASIGDRFADAMFVFARSHRNYLTTQTEPFLYLYPDDRFVSAGTKFSELKRPVVVHAPSSPVIKGTQLVRAAVAKLRGEGYDFEYVELIGMPNDQVMRELARAHIVLAHFYSYAPGVIGVEALASACALVISADETIETGLPVGSNDAWLVTKHWQVYDNLKLLLDEPSRIEPLALYGQQWARDHFTASANLPSLRAVLDRVVGQTGSSRPHADAERGSRVDPNS